MAASFLSTLRAGPPPPRVALLPDGLFFTRAVAVSAGATPAEAAAQVELALEAMAPFPLAQLYYGYFWKPGGENAFVFAAYRRRFTTDQAAAWNDAEIVLPAFAALLGAKVEPATTVVLRSTDGLTAIHWTAPGVPSAVVTRSFPPAPEEETTETLAKYDEACARLREELLRTFEGSRRVIDLDEPPAPEPSLTDREVSFRSGPLVSAVSSAMATALDVRDKGELAALRGARKRDLIFWRVAVGCAATFVLLGLGEFALQGGQQWQKIRKLQQNRQQPLVDKIMNSQALANHIDELATKRLLPVEMMRAIAGKGRELVPAEITFTRAYTKAGAIYTLYVDAKASNAGQIAVYKSALRQLPICQTVESINEGTRGDTATFTLVVTFKPDALKPG